MLNIKALLTKLVGTLGTTTTGTPTITTTTGTLVSSSYIKCGNVVQLNLTVKKSSSTAAGSDVYGGTLTDTALQPNSSGTIGGEGYINALYMAGHITTSGGIVVRNAGGSSLAANTEVTVSFTYIV